MLGLQCEGSKCKILSIGNSLPDNVDGCLTGATPEIVPELRFLGLKIDSAGNISRWKTDFT